MCVYGLSENIQEASVARTQQEKRGAAHERKSSQRHDWLVVWTMAGNDFMLKQQKAFEGLWFGEWHCIIDILREYSAETGLQGEDGNKMS